MNIIIFFASSVIAMVPSIEYNLILTYEWFLDTFKLLGSFYVPGRSSSKECNKKQAPPSRESRRFSACTYLRAADMDQCKATNGHLNLYLFLLLNLLTNLCGKCWYSCSNISCTIFTQHICDIEGVGDVAAGCRSIAFFFA